MKILTEGYINKLRNFGEDDIFYISVSFKTIDGKQEGKGERVKFNTLKEAENHLINKGIQNIVVFQNVVTGNSYANFGKCKNVRVRQEDSGKIILNRENDVTDFEFSSVNSFEEYMDERYFDWYKEKHNILSKLNRENFCVKSMTWTELREKGLELGVYKVGMKKEELINKLLIA